MTMTDATTVIDDTPTTVVVTLIEDILGYEPDEYTLDDTFAGDLEADSLAMIELKVAVEERFNLPDSSQALYECLTPAQVIDYVTLAQQNAGTE